MDFRRWRPELLVLIAAAFVTRSIGLFYPNAVVFDEVYFKTFSAHYLDGHYFFDIHPPLGKLLIALFAHLLGLSPQSMLGGTALSLRMLPALAGIMLVPLIWGILRRLGASRPFAFLGASLVLFDNALLVESRFILMDSMLLLFGMSTLYFYLVARQAPARSRWAWLTLAAASGGAAITTKWTGLGCLALVWLLWLLDQKNRTASWGKRLGELALLGLVPVIIYISAFWVHFQLLPRSGDGDAFMSTHFQETLTGSPYYKASTHLSFLDKFVELNLEMYRANQTLTATHPYGSHWYTWPLEQRPIYYWEGTTLSDGRQGNIYLLGNPIVWWGIWVAIFAGLSYAWVNGRRLRPATITALAIAGGAYFINLIPFMAVTRVMFLYHYFYSFLFSLIFAVMLWNDLAANPHRHQLSSLKHRWRFGAVLALVAAGFLFFAPLSYGTPLSPAGLQSRIWLHTWR